MAIPFAALETKANAAVMRSLANKSLRFNATYIDGIFDDRPSEVNFVESSDPVFTVSTADASDLYMDCSLFDDEKEYKVIEIEPDDSGTTRLELRLKW